jgi:undecaprenol kinase
VKNRSFPQRLAFAFEGLKEVWRREKSFRAQALIGLIAVVATAVLRPGLLWAGVIAISIALVLASELANSAIEYMIDHLHPDVAPQGDEACEEVAVPSGDLSPEA